MEKALNCCRDWKKVPGSMQLCRVLNVDGCLDMGCTWNLERNPGKCLYEGRSVKNNNTGDRRIYLTDGYVEGKTEMDAISLACPKCDVNKVCYLAKGVKNA